MTVGQRILMKRKELGLSQEALGEKLGVSRQAIYKWESDAALPEIEKLVALSKIFSVTVGWLLGAEDAPREADRDEGELTDSQLRMVEELAARYRESTPPKKRRWPKVAAVLVIAAMGFSMLQLNSRLRNLQQDYRNLQSSVSGIDQQVRHQIGAITGQVENVLNRVNSFTTSQHVQVESVDFLENTVTFSLSAAPKTYTEGMTARFTALCQGVTTEVPGVPGEKLDFEGTMTLPLCNDRVDFSVVFVSGSQQDIQPITGFSGLYSRSFPATDHHLYPLFFDIREDSLRLSYDYSIAFPPEKMDLEIPASAVKPEDVRLGLFADQVLVQWMEPGRGEEAWRVPAENGPPAMSEFEKTACHFHGTGTVPLDREKTYCFAFVLTDVYGRELVIPDMPVCFDPRQEDWDFADLHDSSRQAGFEDLSQWKY